MDPGLRLTNGVARGKIRFAREGFGVRGKNTREGFGVHFCERVACFSSSIALFECLQILVRVLDFHLSSKLKTLSDSLAITAPRRASSARF